MSIPPPSGFRRLHADSAGRSRGVPPEWARLERHQDGGASPSRPPPPPVPLETQASQPAGPRCPATKGDMEIEPDNANATGSPVDAVEPGHTVKKPKATRGIRTRKERRGNQRKACRSQPCSAIRNPPRAPLLKRSPASDRYDSVWHRLRGSVSFDPAMVPRNPRRREKYGRGKKVRGRERQNVLHRFASIHVCCRHRCKAIVRPAPVAEALFRA